MAHVKAVRQKKKRSLEHSLVAMIFLCWVVPVLLIMIMLWQFISSNVKKQISQTITTSVYNSVSLCGVSLGSAIEASKQASYIPTVRLSYLGYKNTGDYMTMYDRIMEFLTQQYKYDEKLLCTTLFLCENNKDILYTFNTSAGATYANVLEYKKKAHIAAIAMSQTADTSIHFVSIDGSVYMMRNIVDSSYRPYAVIVSQLNMPVVFGSLENIMWKTDATVWLNGTPVALSNNMLLPQEYDVVLNKPWEIIDTGKNSSIVYGSSADESYKLDYMVAVDSSSLADNFNDFADIMVYLTVLTIPLLILVVHFFVRNVSSPIKSLVSAASRIEQGHFGTQVQKEFGNREFTYLVDNFNSMSSCLRYQFDKLYKEEIALRDAQIMALQSQINPHFLNNTLEIINWEARMGDSAKVTSMIEALSTMLDFAIARNKATLVHLTEELMYVNAYLYIISVRFGRRLVVKKELDDSVMDLPVPRLIMQPVIENAVEHGVSKKQKGTITIRTYKEEELLIIEVENDGGMEPGDEEKIAKLLDANYNAKDESSISLGIRNVNLRLKIIYGEESGLSIKQNKKGNVVARISIDTTKHGKLSANTHNHSLGIIYPDENN